MKCRPGDLALIEGCSGDSCMRKVQGCPVTAVQPTLMLDERGRVAFAWHIAPAVKCPECYHVWSVVPDADLRPIRGRPVEQQPEATPIEREREA